MFPSPIIYTPPGLADVTAAACQGYVVYNLLVALGINRPVIGATNLAVAGLPLINPAAQRIGLIGRRTQHLYLMSIGHLF